MAGVRALRNHEFMRRISRFVLIVVVFVAGCGRSVPPTKASVSREQVWRAIQPLAARYRMDPKFIYALVAAESNFDPNAQNDDARGLLQLKEVAWRTVNADPYEPGVWDWQRNLTSGVEYLAWCRSYLHQKQKFSYPLLLASFHYGIDYVQERDFALSRLDPPDSVIYRELWRGNLSPVTPPKT
jgi:soluble lytic murein transglycosylase-like protein